MKWRGKPLRHWLDILKGQDEAVRGGLTYSAHCLICDLAFELGKSEAEFFRVYEPEERAQLMATYRSQRNRDTVMAAFPVPTQRGRSGIS